MKKRNKPLTSEDEDRSRKNIFTNVHRRLETIPSSKDLELCLEVEMDDDVRELIKCPDKSPSTLLDVTVIKPKGLDNVYTTEKQTLNANLVKKMITSMKINSDEKTSLMQKIFGNDNITEGTGKLEKSVEENNSRKSCLSSKNKSLHKERTIKFDQGDIQSVSDRISKVFSVYSQETDKPVHIKERTSKSLPRKIEQQVYTAPKTFNTVRSMFQCTNKDNKCETHERDSKNMESPCHCQNCAIVGILTDSQKLPFATEEIPEIKRERRNYTPFRKKSVTFRHSAGAEPDAAILRDHSECETIFKQLTSRIKDLEERVRQQEEKAVPKDYFKKIITKLVNHLTKLTHYTTINEDRSSSVKEQPVYKPQPVSPRPKSYDNRYNSKFYVNHCHLDTTKPPKVPAEKEYDPKPCSSQEEDPVITINVAKNCGPTKNMNFERSSSAYPTKYGDSIPLNDSLWKWGGEILKPGIDLKNKIVVLLEDALQNFRRTWEKPTQEQRFHEDLQRFLEEISKNLPKQDRTGYRREKSRERRYSKFSPIRESNSDSSTLNWKKHPKKSKQPMMSRFMRRRGSPIVPHTNINVSYLNPEIKKWVDSQVSFRIQSSEDFREPYEDETTKLHKMHFLKMIENSKTTDKFKLWQSIWNQALSNNQSKNDTVAVQIPDPRDHRRLVKIDYTIGEIEKLLTGVQDEGVNKRKR